MFDAIEDALEALNDFDRCDEARLYIARNYSLDDIDGYDMDYEHREWFRQNHHHHHRSATIVERREGFFGEEEVIIRRDDSPFSW